MRANYLILGAILFLASVQGMSEGRGVEIPDKAVVDEPDFSIGNQYALIIGIDQYQHWPALQFAEQDASEIATILMDEYGFESERVVLLTGTGSTRARVLGELRSLFNGLGEMDNLLIYYAGHGHLDNLTETGYWIPADAKLFDESSWIAFTRVLDLLQARKVRAKNILVVTDSCYGGALMRSGISPGLPTPQDRFYMKTVRELASKRSRQIIASGGFEEVPDRSDFADLLKKALRYNPFPFVDMEFLFFSEVYPQLRVTGQQTPTMGRIVTGPGEDGQFVLARKTGLASTESHSQPEENNKKSDGTETDPPTSFSARIHSQGELIVPDDHYCDLDIGGEDKRKKNIDADFWWEAKSEKNGLSFHFRTEPGVKFIVLGQRDFSSLSYRDLIESGSGTVNEQPLDLGSVVVYRTSQGRWGKLRINSLNKDSLRITWVTYDFETS